MQQRSIKFRAWDNEAKKYRFSGCTIQNIIELKESGAVIDDSWTLEQFTGLLDKNDKEIYEGDIVGFYEFLPDETWDGGKVVIAWDAQNARFATPFTEAGFKVPPESVEVIGNIHENPDLIESGEIKPTT